jgi:hypothetical protein
MASKKALKQRIKAAEVAAELAGRAPAGCLPVIALNATLR